MAVWMDVKSGNDGGMARWKRVNKGGSLTRMEPRRSGLPGTESGQHCLPGNTCWHHSWFALPGFHKNTLAHKELKS